MDYFASGGVITNRLLFADGRVVEDIVGGSAIFALEGIKLWNDSASLIANVGEDFDSFYGEWMRNNKLSFDNIKVKVERTNYHYVKYFPDGTYFEESIYGPSYGWRNSGYCATSPKDIANAVKKSNGDKGLYILFDSDRIMWQQLMNVKKEYGVKIMCEIRTVDCKPEKLQRILEIIDDVEIYSINLPEAKSLFSVDSEDDAIEKLKAIGKPVYFRVGKKGAYMIADKKHYFVPTITSDYEIDPTGCGNCSTGAAMVAFFEGYDPAMVGIMAGLAASYNVRQFGPYPLIDQKVKEEAMKKALELRQAYRN